MVVVARLVFPVPVKLTIKLFGLLGCFFLGVSTEKSATLLYRREGVVGLNVLIAI
jgi:hypothetical protein